MNTYEKALKKIMEDKEKYKSYINNRVILGPTGATGPIGPTGEKGEPGVNGTSVSILGNYNTFDELISKHPIGELGQGYLIDNDLFIWSPENNIWINVGEIKGPMGPQGPTGPKGTDGKDGTSVSILGSFNSLEELKSHIKVGHIGDGYLINGNLYVWTPLNNNWTNVGHIMGPKGENGDIGPKGDIGPTGPIGPKGDQGQIGPQGPKGENGKDGTSVEILGSFNSIEELRNKHSTGKPGDSYLINADLYVWSSESNDWINVGHIMGPQGPKGDIGPTGPKGDQGPRGFQGPQGIEGQIGPKGEKGDTGPAGIPGPLKIPTLLVLTSNKNVPDDGLKIDSDYRLPLEASTFDNTNSFYVTNRNNTITFLKAGTYKIEFIVQAHATNQSNSQDGSNIISIGFRKIEESTVYAGNSVFADKTIPTTIVGHGIVKLTTPNQLFELVNLSNFPIFLQSPKLTLLNTDSSPASPIVSVMIQAIEQ